LWWSDCWKLGRTSTRPPQDLMGEPLSKRHREVVISLWWSGCWKLGRTSTRHPQYFMGEPLSKRHREVAIKLWCSDCWDLGRNRHMSNFSQDWVVRKKVWLKMFISYSPVFLATSFGRSMAFCLPIYLWHVHSFRFVSLSSFNSTRFTVFSAASDMRKARMRAGLPLDETFALAMNLS
jgi:hypothetical protein